MTADIVQRFAKEHGLSSIRSMIVISELLGNKKAPALTGARSKDMIDNFSVEQLGW